jgi:hypothetical protein
MVALSAHEKQRLADLEADAKALAGDAEALAGDAKEVKTLLDDFLSFNMAKRIVSFKWANYGEVVREPS